MPNWITVEDSLKGRERAVERERQRIIKLLEQEEAERLGQGGITEALTIRSVIALIKDKQNPHVRAETNVSNVENIVNIVNSACSCGFKEEESGSPLCGCGCGDLYGEQNHE
ncbi:hypothetical protein UFOVP325_19 [uncultured Caudovirales phage]|uniref:Uncharacterized protein n=1 Tax=uncultured Caudovirales phage TaxID=2100421 RepID=A0A6J5LZD6_9CAUD|nr:hypothetical protein UFOVP325_19 [uncultured Caudovirales phage]CAB4147169.1 hypothetical protein UFOVP430_14 [uncultured Caudovirales phage]